MRINAYLDSSCGWSRGVMETLERFNLPHTAHWIDKSQEAKAQMERSFAGHRAPCIEIDGIRLPDTTGEELEKYLLANRLVAPILPSEAQNHPVEAEQLLHRRIARANTQRFF